MPTPLISTSRNAPDYCGPVPRVIFDREKGFIIGIEPVRTMWGELRELLAANWEAVEQVYRPDETFDPDFERLMELEEANSAFCVTIRGNTSPFNMVGYCLVFISRDLHVKSVYKASEGGVYIVPECRSFILFKQLLDFVEETLKKCGIDLFYVTSKSPVDGPNLGTYLLRREYRHISEVYAVHLLDERS